MNPRYVSSAKRPLQAIQHTREDHVDLRELWRIAFERRRAVLTGLLTTVIATALVTFLSTPSYLASTMLQLERRAPDILTFQDIVDVDAAGYKDFFRTQHRIIQSQSVLRLAVERLDLVNRPTFLARKRSPIGRLRNWGGRVFLGHTEQDDPLERAVRFIEDGVLVTLIGKSQLVEISFLDEDAGLAAEVANAVSDAYQDFNFQMRFTTTEQAGEFLTKEVARLQAEIAEREHRLQQYGVENTILPMSDGIQDISEQALADLNLRLTRAKSELAHATARYDGLSHVGPDSLAEVLTSPFIQHLKQQLAEVERRSSKLAGAFRSDWPAMTQLDEELKQIRERLEVETRSIVTQVRLVAENQLKQAVAEVVELKEEVERQKGEVQRVHRDAVEYATLKNEIDTRRDVLQGLIARRSETEVSGQLREAAASNIRVVDRAEKPDEPARPRKVLNLSLSVLLGLGVGLGMAFLMHHVDNTIKTEADLEHYATGAAVLGHVPLFVPLGAADGGKKARILKYTTQNAIALDLASHQSPGSPFAESLRNLRTALLLSSADSPPWLIHITSSEPQDGKSTIAINLAIILTQLGREVLLVDADLRRPRLHRALKTPDGIGLSTFLSGNADVGDLFQKTVVPGLSLVTSGPIPPNPSELLGSSRLDLMISRLREMACYDHVLFDSPPLIQVADSLLLGTRMNATILIVRAGATTREALVSCISKLNRVRVKVAGTVLNAASDTSRPYYGYYHNRLYRRGGQRRRNVGAETVIAYPTRE